MKTLGFALFVTATLGALACKTEPADTDSGTGTSTGTTAPGATEPATTEPGTTTSSTSGVTTTDAPVTTSNITGITTDSGTTTGTSGPVTTEGTTGPENPRCMMYCEDIMTNCTGENAQYPSLESCVNICDAFRDGMPDDVTGNSFACRRYHTTAAGMDAPTHCVHAGPGGAGVCGDNCDGFCTIALAICPAQYVDVDGCMAECGGFADTEKYDTADVSGDSLACRLYHLAVAATDDPSAATHCPHIVAMSATCV